MDLITNLVAKLVTDLVVYPSVDLVLSVAASWAADWGGVRIWSWICNF